MSATINTTFPYYQQAGEKRETHTVTTEREFDVEGRLTRETVTEVTEKVDYPSSVRPTWTTNYADAPATMA